MIKSDLDTGIKAIDRLKQLATAEGVFALFQLEATSARNSAPLRLVDTDDLWSLRAATFLSLYQISRNKSYELGYAFQLAWQTCERIKMLDESQLPKYAAWVAHYERGELVTHRCTSCKTIFASSTDNLAHECVLHR